MVVAMMAIIPILVIIGIAVVMIPCLVHLEEGRILAVALPVVPDSVAWGRWSCCTCWHLPSGRSCPRHRPDGNRHAIPSAAALSAAGVRQFCAREGADASIVNGKQPTRCLI